MFEVLHYSMPQISRAQEVFVHGDAEIRQSICFFFFWKLAKHSVSFFFFINIARYLQPIPGWFKTKVLKDLHLRLSA